MNTFFQGERPGINLPKQLSMLLCLCLIVHTCCSQNLNYIHYNTNNSNLPHNVVYKLHQDKNGFLWIPTDNSLVRFDGLEMKKYDAGLISKYTIAADDDQNGRLWVVTWKGGIHFIDKSSDTAVIVKEKRENYEKTSYSFYRNQVLVHDSLIICHCFQSYCVFNYSSHTNTIKAIWLQPGVDQLRYKPDPMYGFEIMHTHWNYYTFLKTRTNQLYAYNQDGIYSINGLKMDKLDVSVHPDEIWESHSGDMYYREGNDIFLSDTSFSRSALVYRIPLYRFPRKKITCFRVLPSGNIVIGMANPGIPIDNTLYYLLNTRTGEIFDLKKELRIESLFADMIVDQEGSIWLATDGDGVYHVFDKKYTLIRAEKALNNNMISSVVAGKNRELFIGTRSGVYVYQSGTLKPLPGFPSNTSCYVNDMFYTPEKNLGVAVVTKIAPKCYVYDLRDYYKGKVPVADPKKHSGLSRIFYSKNFRVEWYISWYLKIIETSSGINYTKNLRPLIYINDIAEDDKKTLWLATNEGLYYYNTQKELTRFEHKDFFSGPVNCLLYDAGRGLWVGTARGLYLFRPGGHIKYWDVKDGLGNLNVNCLYKQAANSSLWIGTQEGLYNLRGNNFRLFKRRDGLVADDVTSFAALSDHELAISSQKGITLFYLDTVFPAPRVPGLLVEKIMVDSRSFPVKGTSVIDIPYKGSLSLMYNAVTFMYPELVEFEYRLNPDEPWIQTRNKSLVFTNLKPGSYLLQIRMKNSNDPSGASFSLKLIIHSPWWQTIYFYAAIFLLMAGMLYLVLLRRLRKQKKEIRIKQELSGLKLKALQTQLNPHFVSNSLNAIQYFTLNQDEIKANQYLTQFADLTRLMLETSRVRFISLKTELDILELYLSLEKLRFEDKFEYDIAVDPAIDTVNTFLPGMLVQPFAENSINHGIVYLKKSKKGKLKIDISRKGNGIQVIVDDNGIGRDKARKIKTRSQRAYRSRSTEIINEIQQVVNTFPGCEIRTETADKISPGGQAMGTTVMIFINIDNKLLQAQSSEI